MSLGLCPASQAFSMFFCFHMFVSARPSARKFVLHSPVLCTLKPYPLLPAQFYGVSPAALPLSEALPALTVTTQLRGPTAPSTPVSLAWVSVLPEGSSFCPHIKMVVTSPQNFVTESAGLFCPQFLTWLRIIITRGGHRSMDTCCFIFPATIPLSPHNCGSVLGGNPLTLNPCGFGEIDPIPGSPEMK